MNSKLHRINLIAITIVIFYTIFVQAFIVGQTSFNPIIANGLSFLTSVGFYQILVDWLYIVVARNKFLLKLYWGNQFVDGLWYYTYTIEGEHANPHHVFVGVWRFDQDLFRTKVTGFGLNEELNVRSRVRSITDMFENNGAYEIINVRTDRVDPDKEYYSKSSMLFDSNKKNMLGYPLKIRGRTTIYGGVLSGDIHEDVLYKCEGAKTEDDAILELKEYLLKNTLSIVSIKAITLKS